MISIIIINACAKSTADVFSKDRILDTLGQNKYRFRIVIILLYPFIQYNIICTYDDVAYLKNYLFFLSMIEKNKNNCTTI